MRDIMEVLRPALKSAEAKFGASHVPGVREITRGPLKGNVAIMLLAFHQPRVVAYAATAEELAVKCERGQWVEAWCRGCGFPADQGHRPYCMEAK